MTIDSAYLILFPKKSASNRPVLNAAGSALIIVIGIAEKRVVRHLAKEALLHETKVQLTTIEIRLC